MAISNKIDFTLITTVTNANPNGDPLNGNRPRETNDGFGLISDVCIKRKIRNRLQAMGEKIFVQSNDNCNDGFDSLQSRAEANPALKAVANGKSTDQNAYRDAACKEWIDVRSFGQLFAFANDKISVGVRGPVTIRQGLSVSPIEITGMQITKSVNSASKQNGKASDTMGTKNFVPFGAYLIHGSINCQLAEKTGFSEEDAEKIKQALCTLFEGDCSAARPDGSMDVCALVWWKHAGKIPSVPQHTSANLHNATKLTLKDGVVTPRSINDYNITIKQIDGITPEIIKIKIDD